eukprot:COSAG01_NODE_30977_length_606_cov_0.790927_2_plen_40_part_01
MGGGRTHGGIKADHQDRDDQRPAENILAFAATLLSLRVSE